jgi:hypothetical protein
MQYCTRAQSKIQGGRQASKRNSGGWGCEKTRQLRRKSTARQGPFAAGISASTRLFPAFPTTTKHRNAAQQPSNPTRSAVLDNHPYSPRKNVPQRSFAELLAPQHRPLAEAPAAVASASAARAIDGKHGGSREPGSDDGRPGAGHASTGRIFWRHVSRALFRLLYR